MRGRACLLALALAASGAAGAGAEADARAEEAEARVREELRDQVRRRVGTLAVRYSYPERLSFAGGVLAFRRPRDYDGTTVCDFRGPLAQVEAGTGGGSVSFGWGSLVGERGRNAFFLRNAYVGYSWKGSILRTWGSTPLDPAAQTLVGLRADFTISIACFRLGAFRRVSSAPGAPRWLLSGGIGWGF